MTSYTGSGINFYHDFATKRGNSASEIGVSVSVFVCVCVCVCVCVFEGVSMCVFVCSKGVYWDNIRCIVSASAH